MRYRSKPTEIEAMQWRFGRERPESLHEWAEKVVAWVNANGGAARYDPAHSLVGDIDGMTTETDARIAVRTINGWAYAEPGHYVVMGSTWFDVPVEKPDPRCADHNVHYCPECPEEYEWKTLRDFYPRDPETFESRWEPTGETP